MRKKIIVLTSFFLRRQESSRYRIVIPAKAGIQCLEQFLDTRLRGYDFYSRLWIPAFAGMTMSLLTMGNAHAATLPACAVSQNMSAQKPYGTASLHKLFFHVYDAELWIDDAQKKQFNWQDAHAHFALHLTYHVDIDAEDFLERTLEELDHQPDVTAAMKAEFKKQLTTLYPNVMDGDSITAVRDSKEGLILCHQGKVRGAITDAAMVRAFFAIWLGEHSSEPELRDTLLGYTPK